MPGPLHYLSDDLQSFLDSVLVSGHGVDHERLKQEIESFRELWKGGYFTGDPLEPLGWSGLGPYGYISVPHAIYQACIAAYVRSETVALEIGPGRGAWTRGLLPSREVWVLDALSAEHNGFWDYVGVEHQHVHYIQVDDFSCSALPNDNLTYLFSYDALCHVSFDGIREYLTNLRGKLRSGAECFVMVADYEKYNRFIVGAERHHVRRAGPIYDSRLDRRRLVHDAWRLVLRSGEYTVQPLSLNEDSEPSPGRWYNAGTERTCQLLRDLGYLVVSADIGLSPRDPIIHFQQP